MRTALIIFGSVLPMISTLVYVRSILARHTRPHRTTYALFVLITSLGFFSLLAEGTSAGLWLAGVSVLQVSLICGLSIKYGMGGQDPFDVICGLLCLIGIAAWLATGESMLGLYASLLADFLALLPTMRKMWRHPHTEPPLFYGLDTAAALAILAASTLTWNSLLYPLYLTLVNFACLGIIVGRKNIVEYAYAKAQRRDSVVSSE